MVMQDCPGVLERLGLAYLRQQHTQRGLGCPASAGAGPPTQLSHCPNLGLTCQPPPLTTVLIFNWKPHKVGMSKIMSN